MAEETPISKLLKTITEFLSNNQTTLTNLVLSGITVGFNVLLNSEIFDCPVKKYENYGFLFLFVPFVILFFASILVVVWNPRFKLCSEACRSWKDCKCIKCFRVTTTSVTRVLVAPIVWLIVSFAETDYYVCAKVGPGPDKFEELSMNLTTDETEAKNALIAETKTESQIIAWALFVSMVAVTFLVIAVCEKGKTRGYLSRTLIPTVHHTSYFCREEFNSH